MNVYTPIEPSRHRFFRPAGTAVFLGLLLAQCTVALAGQTRYVSPTGADNQPGTLQQPWRTIGKAAATLVAGDTVLIAPGDYNENVFETTSGAPGAYITYRAQELGTVSLRAFRILAEHVYLDGLTFTRNTGIGTTWEAAVRLEREASHCVITNCFFVNAPHVIAHDFRFLHENNEMQSPSSDFVAAGFEPGSKVYLGASGLEGLYYENHDTAWIVASNKATSMWLTNATGLAFIEDPGTNYWVFVIPGTNPGGVTGIRFVVSGNTAASNVVVSGNTFSNWVGHAVALAGNGSLIENNLFTKMNSYRFISFDGSNHIIRRNLIRDCPNVLDYTQEEVSQLIHPPGTGWYDFQISMMFGVSDSAAIARTNVLVESNWFENVVNQLGRVNDGQDDTYDILFRNNVFIGVSAHFSSGRDGMHWVSNTFYRSSYDSVHPLSIGGRWDLQTNYVVSHNLFVDCGSPNRVNVVGWYGVFTNVIDPELDFNMVAGPEIRGFAGKDSFVESNGVNGGDPCFFSVVDFLGPDGVPFTNDDGLQVLPNSLGASIGGGALGVYKVVTNHPIAHFRIVSPLGWFEPLGDDYDPDWLALSPTQRGRVQRPFMTPASLGDPPVTAVFDASGSLSGVDGSITTEAIDHYRWGVAGLSVTNSGPLFTNTFFEAGDYWIRLTVRNTAGFEHTTENIYRVGPFPRVVRPRLNLSRIATGWELRWVSMSGAHYLLQSTGTFGPWDDLLPEPLAGTGEEMTVVDESSLGGDASRIYRLSILAP